MATIADMIASRLRQIDEAYASESARQNRASGGALARAREQRLWDALHPDEVRVWTPDGPKTLREITDLASGLKAEMRVERAARGITPALKQMTQLDRTMERIIVVAASRASDREALRRAPT